MIYNTLLETWQKLLSSRIYTNFKMATYMATCLYLQYMITLKQSTILIWLHFPHLVWQLTRYAHFKRVFLSISISICLPRVVTVLSRWRLLYVVIETIYFFRWRLLPLRDTKHIQQPCPKHRSDHHSNSFFYIFYCWHHLYMILVI